MLLKKIQLPETHLAKATVVQLGSQVFQFVELQACGTSEGGLTRGAFVNTGFCVAALVAQKIYPISRFEITQ